jgi:quercetin dioxygenase-like cupin family protein
LNATFRQVAGLSDGEALARFTGLPRRLNRFIQIAPRGRVIAPLADIPHQLAHEGSRLGLDFEQKTLLVDKQTGLLTALMRMAPGAKLPDHEHVKIEQTYVLEGTLMCPEGECKTGQFVWRPAGSRHHAWAGPQGGLFLAIFQAPNKFFQSDGRVTDFLGRDWQETWGQSA